MNDSNRMCFRIVFDVLLIILSVEFAITAPLQLQSSPSSTFELILLHNNDMHARFQQIDQNTNKCRMEDIAANRCYGGFARVSHVIKKYREEAERGGPAVLYLNAGDTYTGTPWFSIFKHKVSSEFMNLVKPDAMVSWTKLNLIVFCKIILISFSNVIGEPAEFSF